jgi:hypothetical protein
MTFCHPVVAWKACCVENHPSSLMQGCWVPCQVSACQVFVAEDMTVRLFVAEDIIIIMTDVVVGCVMQAPTPPTCIDEVMVFADLSDCTNTCCSHVCSSNNAGRDPLGVGVDIQGFRCLRRTSITRHPPSHLTRPYDAMLRLFGRQCTKPL